MRLRLDGVPVTNQESKRRRMRALDVLADVRQQAEEMGLPSYPQPATTPEPLGDVDFESLANQELESLIARYTGYASYVNTRLAEAEVAYKVSTANLRAVAAALKASLFKDEVPKAEIDARVQNAPEYVEQELEHLKLYAMKEILTAHYQAYSKAASAVSRVVELRKLDYEQQLREHTVGRQRRSRFNTPIPDRKIQR